MFEVPLLEEYGHEDWTTYETRRWKVRTRNQEMAENAERQMEEYDDWRDRSGAYLTTEQFLEREAEEELNRAVFEHNSTATSDPHIRISHVSPIVNHASSCAGCRCDCRDNMSAGCCGHVCPACRNRGEWVEV